MTAIVTFATPLQALAATPAVKTPPAPPSVKVKTGNKAVTPIIPTLAFSANPSDIEIKTARVFSEPLIAMPGAAVPGENAALPPHFFRLRTEATTKISQASNVSSAPFPTRDGARQSN